LGDSSRQSIMRSDRWWSGKRHGRRYIYPPARCDEGR
jgi:hypothetical protein